jgi:hypothetical protein
MKAYRGRGVIPPVTLNLYTRRTEWPALTLAAFAQDRTSILTEYDAGWAPEPVWTPWRREKSLSLYLREFLFPFHESFSQLPYSVQPLPQGHLPNNDFLYR